MESQCGAQPVLAANHHGLREHCTVSVAKVNDVWSENCIGFEPRWFVTPGLEHRVIS
jgi:hypothetical protein